jgi:hypothetical protein
MKYGKFRFDSIKEFQQIQSLAVANGVGTAQELEKFLLENYSNKLVK